jgi:glutathione reductase (NADPH)
MENFDLIVIGSGSAGLAVAYPCRQKGWEVAVIDNKPFGGTCANRGCDPKKVLVGGADTRDTLDRFFKIGVMDQKSRINWPKLINFKQTFVKNVPKDTEDGLIKAGIKTFHGRAKFISDRAVEVNGEELSAKNIVIATGSDPAPLNIPGEELVTISDDFLNLKSLPKRIVFIGGGYISFEFSHLVNRAGSEAVILHRSERVLSGFDPDLVNLLVKASSDLGIKIETNTAVTEIEKTAAGFLIKTKTKEGKQKTYQADLVVHGGGRVPNVTNLDPEKAGLEYDQKGVKVDEFLESVSSPGIFSAGDAVNFGLPLTPVAAKSGQIVAHNLLNPDQKRPANFSEIPSVVFTIPPLATVGLTEDQIKQKKLSYEVHFGDTGSWYSSKRINEPYSGHKTFIEKKTGRILGANLLGHSSEELINIFALAIAHNLTSEDLKNLVYSFPTRSSDIEYMV